MDQFSSSLPRAVQLARILIESRLQPGDLAIDATLGNGHDALFLAERVGANGRVLGFDVQEAAITATRKKTAEFAQIELIHAGHQHVAEYLSSSPKVAMFNLGYLPGADKAIITCAETTIAALQALTDSLQSGGMITLVVYTGHEGGLEESAEISQWCSKLDQSSFTVIEYGFVNQRNSPPSLVALERK